MLLADFLRVIQWWFLLFILGMGSLPLTTFIFARFIDRGYAFSKIISIILISYSVLLLSSLHVLKFSILSIIIIFFFILLMQGIIFVKKLHSFSFTKIIKKYWTIFVFEEILFFFILVFWSYIRGFAPEIYGLEKFMDYGFINSLLRSEYLPPKDIWLTPLTINYYYFGHLTTAVLTKISLIPANYTYNLMLASLVALTFTASFSIGITLYSFIQDKKRRLFNILVAGILSALLVTFSGNLHTLYSFFKPYENEKPVPFWNLEFAFLNPCYQKKFYTQSTEKGTSKIIKCDAYEQQKFFSFPNSYWYPNATRFIKNTIHEFPIYSWVVADLHGHVLDVPFVLLSIAFLLSLFLSSQFSKDAAPKFKRHTIKDFSLLSKTITDKIPLNLSSFLFLSFLLAILYMTNAWDGLIYFLLSVVLLAYLQWDKTQYKQHFIHKVFLVGRETIFPLVVLIGGFIVFSLPFSLFFKPFISGIGILCSPQFLTQIGKIGPFLFEPNHCDRSPLWQLFILHGFFIFFIIIFLLFIHKSKTLLVSDKFILFLVTLSLFLILLPELIYAKDIYPAHYRANTMFKLVFQSFIMLSLASGYIIARTAQRLKNTKTLKGLLIYSLFFISCFILLAIVFIYPYLAINSYYQNVLAFTSRTTSSNYQGLDGTAYLKEKYPHDFAAIQWIQKNIHGQPVILEAQGDSYTDYARVSTNTGLPTILGWTVHEWLWRGTYNIPAPRIEDIKRLYESNDLEETKSLLKKYNVEYVFLGSLEREKYPQLKKEKFQQIGRKVFQSGETVIYKLASSF